MSNSVPCKGCKERFTACHDTCKKYKKWVELSRKKNDWLKKQRYSISTLDFTGTSPKPGKHRKIKRK